MGRVILTQHQWERIEPIIAGARGKARSKRTETTTAPNIGRPPRDDKKVFEAVLWILMTRRPWRELPSRYPSAATCSRRLCEWRTAPCHKKGFKGYMVWDLAWRFFFETASPQKQKFWGKAVEMAKRRPGQKQSSGLKTRKKGQSQRIDEEWISRCAEIMGEIIEEKRED